MKKKKVFEIHCLVFGSQKLNKSLCIDYNVCTVKGGLGEMERAPDYLVTLLDEDSVLCGGAGWGIGEGGSRKGGLWSRVRGDLSRTDGVSLVQNVLPRSLEAAYLMNQPMKTLLSAFEWVPRVGTAGSHCLTLLFFLNILIGV